MGYALIEDKDGRADLESTLQAKQSISAEMAGLGSWLAENDGTLVGTAAGIKLAAKLAGEKLKKSKGDGGISPATAMLRPYLDLYGRVVVAMPSEVSLALAGIRCDKQGFFTASAAGHGSSRAAWCPGLSPEFRPSQRTCSP